MNKPNDDIVLRATGVAKVYEEGDLRTGVLSNVNFALRRGETMAIVGASGCGKSTLLRLLAGLDTEYSGKLLHDGAKIPSQFPCTPTATSTLSASSLSDLFDSTCVTSIFTPASPASIAKWRLSWQVTPICA